MHTPMFSLEVFPPKRDAPVGTIYDTLDGLEGLNPDFISVTYGHGTHSDRTATARIANTIHGEYGIPAVAHLTALYSDEAKIDEALDMFEAAGVSAVLALRGDYIDGEESAASTTPATSRPTSTTASPTSRCSAPAILKATIRPPRSTRTSGT